jgi:hypothetical protein
MSAIVSGLIGGVIAAALTAYIASKVGKAKTPGVLHFGPFMWGLAIASLAMALLPVAITVFAGHDRDLWAKVVLFLAFCAGAVYSFAEAARVHGRFDDDGIEFYTPWTGLKRENWRDLVSVELNDWRQWYTLSFRTGTKIRLSRYLHGHLSALKKAGYREEA